MADRKKHARSGHRSSTTKLLTRIDEALRASPLDGDWIASLKMSLNEKLEKLKTLDREIEELLDGEDELAEEIERTDEYMERVHEAVAKLNKVLNPRLSSADSVTRPTASAEPVTRPPAPPAARTVKLPRLTLPWFSGNILKWSSFWDSYASAVHNNPDLSDVDKFNYLRSLLEGSAYDAIAGLTLSSATYSEAIEILGKRYGDKQVIITKHMEKLLGTEAVESDKNLRGLRRLHDDVESHIRSLYALGVAPESYGAMLTPVLINKLPPEVRLEISRKFTGDVPEVDKILKAVEEELRARERMLSHMHTAAPHRQHEKPRTPTTMLYTSSRFTKPTCCYCQEPHPSNDCIKIKDTNARKQILRSGGRCFNCLGRGHISRTCRSSSRCSKCKGRHHSSICESHDSPRSLVKPNPANSTTLNPSATPFTSTSSNLCSSKNKTVLLQTARAQIYNLSTPRHPVEVRLLLDSGSQRSYLSERARAMLALESVGEQKLAISTFGSTQEQQQSCPVVKVGMKVNGSPPMNLSLFVVPVVCEPLFSQPVSVCVSEYPHLASLSLADETDGASRLDVDLLIGSDFYWDIVTGGVSRGAQGPVAIHTKLGWVLSGPAQHENTTKVSTNLITTHVLKVDSQPTNADLEKELQSFWDLESLGIVGPEKTLYDQFLSTVTTKNNRYEVTLPWKEHHKALPDNYQLSLRRLKGLLHRLRQAPAVLQQYHSIISDQLKQGIVEPAPDNGNLCHYLPHHAVIREDKMTTKLRIVYDASARSEDAPSLNDCIHKGPKFNQIILDLLLRFRQFRVPLIADLEKAFLQVSVAEDDRDVLRFLWIDDITKENPDVCALRFTRVVFGLAASPFLLNATVRHHLQKYATSHPALVQRLLQSMYVDDIITGVNTEDEAFQLYEQSKRLFQEAGFNLRKFVTNRRSLQLRINHAEQACASQQQESQEMNYSDETYGRATLGITVDTEAEEQKVLGLRWRPGDDLLLFDTSTILQLASSVKPTKRNVISVVGKFYDPLGFPGPVIIRFKVFFQRLCSNKIAWDQPLPAVLLQEWKHLLDNSLGGPPLTIPRSYSASHDAVVVSHHLCGFCDASSHAFAAVIYLARVTEEKTKISFVTAKTRVAPSRPHTIPRLELLPALLLSRLIVSVANCLQPLLQHIEFKCFTDSQVTQYWIEGVHKEWKPFIQNRVEEIRRAVPPSCWAHCPGDTNPADLPSRGVSQSELLVSRLWHFGPDWLPAVVTSQEDKSMPTTSCSKPMPKECVPELKIKPLASHCLLTAETYAHPSVGSILQIENDSNLRHLLRVTAYVVRALNKFKRKSQSNISTLSAMELADSELSWLLWAQVSLTKEKHFQTWQKQLNLFHDKQGLLRCGGRLGNAPVSYATKYPILLPRDHYLTTLIVKDAHERVRHNGVTETLNEIRKRYWIVKGRSLVKIHIHRCVLCRRFEGPAYQGPPPPPLPEFKLKEQPPFSYTGVDFAGPIHVRTFGHAKSDKVWICLFTCLVVRAVHLETVTDLSTETFLRCLKRFTARRGFPFTFLSDNGKTFKAAAVFIKTVFQDSTVQDHLSRRGVDWRFNVERAPWWGGVFERLVRSTKRCLRKMVGHSRLSLDELNTALIKVEAVINSRPLTYVSSSNLQEPLTPSHFLTRSRVLNLPDYLGYSFDPTDEDFTLTTTTTSQLRERLGRLNNALDHFWARWREEYLAELRECHRYVKNDSTHRPVIAVGDIVIVHDEKLPRGHWKLGKVEEVICGHDGKIRAATVRLPTGNSILRRPVQLLYPLEVSDTSPNDISGAPVNIDVDDRQADNPSNHEVPSENLQSGQSLARVNDTGSAEADTVDGSNKRPRRTAALKAKKVLKALSLQDKTDSEG